MPALPRSNLILNSTPQLNVSRHLARNIIDLRQLKNLTQNAMAGLAGLPRSTVTNLENGAANPSLDTLLKVSKALQISLMELLQEPRSQVTLIKNHERPLNKKSKPGVRIQNVFHQAMTGLEIEEIELEPKQGFKGNPHLKGTKEFLLCLEGQIEVTLQEQKYLLSAGETLNFPADQPHAYMNRSNSKRALAISAVLLV